MTIDNFYFYLPNRLIQTSQTGGQQYCDTSPFSIACIGGPIDYLAREHLLKGVGSVQLTSSLR